MDLLSGEALAALISVLFIDLILSGDNAVVIAMAARRLEGANRRRAIFWGAAAAVALRLFFAAIVTFLLQIPFLQVIGAVLLVWIAWRLVNDGDSHEDEENVKAGSNVWDAIRIILVADAVMSLDNVIALVGAARINGEVSLVLLGIGLAMTIPLVIFGASLLTSLLDRLPILVYLGAGLLVFLAVEMVFQDVALHDALEPYASFEVFIAVGTAAVFAAGAYLWRRRTQNIAKAS